MKPVECLLCYPRHYVTTEDQRRLHLRAHHPVESVTFQAQSDESLLVFFAAIESLN